MSTEHPSGSSQPDEIPTRPCFKCERVFPLDSYHRHKVGRDGRHPYCPECRNEVRRVRRGNDPLARQKAAVHEKRYYAKNPEKRAAAVKRRNSSRPKDYVRRCHLKYAYGISLEDFAAMHDRQGGVCAICGKPETRVHANGAVCPLHVDHDHVTGRVRGLLCHHCNIAVGQLSTPGLLAKAAQYLSPPDT